MSQPIVFVDIDGVLNTNEEYANFDRAKRADYRLLFNPLCVARLNRLVGDANAAVVLSSSWRLGNRWDLLLVLLKQVGIKGPILGPTPPRVPNRLEAIDAWLQENRPAGTQMVILDDEPQESFLHLAPWAIEVDAAYGLRDDDLRKALLILCGAPWRP